MAITTKEVVNLSKLFNSKNWKRQKSKNLVINFFTLVWCTGSGFRFLILECEVIAVRTVGRSALIVNIVGISRLLMCSCSVYFDLSYRNFRIVILIKIVIYSWKKAFWNFLYALLIHASSSLQLFAHWLLSSSWFFSWRSIPHNKRTFHFRYATLLLVLIMPICFPLYCEGRFFYFNKSVASGR